MAFNKYLLKNYLFLWGILFVVALVIFNTQMVSFGGNPVLRPRLDRIEPFVSKEKVDELCKEKADKEVRACVRACVRVCASASGTVRVCEGRARHAASQVPPGPVVGGSRQFRRRA
jgi:hypothetical protein